jgi:hypothetical protein
MGQPVTCATPVCPEKDAGATGCGHITPVADAKHHCVLEAVLTAVDRVVDGVVS